MLDPKGRMEVIGTIQKLHKEKNITVISITHDLDEAAQADRIVLMEQGQIQQIGTPEEIFKLGTKLVEKGTRCAVCREINRSTSRKRD